MHDAISVGLPLLAILAGILFNRSDTRELRSEMRAELQKIHDKIDRVDRESDQKINELKSELSAKIDANRDAAHRDSLEILRSMTSLHERVAIVEERQNR